MTTSRATLFQTEKTNARTPGVDPGDPPTVLEGRQRVEGFEIGLNGRLTQGLSAFVGYTHLESEVLDLMCQGLSNKVIGRRLNLSENTVRGHVQAVLAALQVSSRSEAGFAARRRGIVA